jgi:ATP-binding cassette subfamily B protein/subfamily B ATP-binding cassette protein MsbA
MQYFLKTIALSLRYKWSILGSIFFALAVAGFWGASIWAVYPVITVVFEGKTLQSWLDENVQNAQAQAEDLRQEIADLKSQLETAAEEERGVLSSRLALRRGRLGATLKSADFYLSLRPYIRRWGPTTPLGTLALVIALLVLTTVLKGVCLIANHVLVARVGAATMTDLRRIVFRELLRADLVNLDRSGISNLVTMVSHNVRMVQQGLVAVYGKSVREPLKMLSCMAIACAISWQLLLLSMITVPIGGAVIYYLGRRMKMAAGGEMRGYSALFKVLLESMSAIKLVRIFGAERRERLRFKATARSLYDLQLRIVFFDSLIRPITELTAMATLGLAVLCGASLVLNQQTHLFGLSLSSRPLTASEMLTFFAMLAGIADPARKLSDIYNVVLRAVAMNKVLYHTIENKPKIVRPAEAKQTPLHQRSIRFQNVTFGYEPDKPVLRDFTLEIPFGQTVALVGVNGSGKSTLVNLLARFYDPQQGGVYLDDVDLRELCPRQLRRQIALVPQDPFLFDDTVVANVRYGSWWAPRNKIVQAARVAHAQELLGTAKREGTARVGDRGRRLSGGQRQRVAMARALLKDPRILILDEATSQLDAQTEAAVHELLAGYLENRTSLIITHRPSTLALADRVVVLENGRVVKDLNAEQFRSSRQQLVELLSKAA